MSKVYVIGSGIHVDRLEEIRVAVNIPANTEIICVSSVEEIPIEDRGQSLINQSVHKFELCDRTVDPIYFEKPNKKIKGWQRPYKFHK